ncbi:zfp36l2-A, partial [Symbiodinium natans]
EAADPWAPGFDPWSRAAGRAAPFPDAKAASAQQNPWQNYRPPSAGIGAGNLPRSSDEDKPARKTKLCRYFRESYYCKAGEFCNFAHGEKDLKERTEAASNWRTERCPRLVRMGWCREPDCTFAHCEQELRKVQNQAQINLKGTPPPPPPPPDPWDPPRRRWDRARWQADAYTHAEAALFTAAFLFQPKPVALRRAG